MLHNATMEILGEMGIRFFYPPAVEILKKAGCRILNDNLVRFPASLVEKALKTAPKKVVIYNQKQEPVMELAGRKAYFGNGSDLLTIIDHETDLRRRAVKIDVDRMIMCLDALPHVDFVMSGFLPSDVPADKVERVQMFSMLTQTEKPIVYVTVDFSNTRLCIEMARVAAAGNFDLSRYPFALNYINVSNPLKHNPDSIQKLMWLSEQNLPFVYRPAIVTRGITTPITGAGFLAVNNAAGLAGLVLSQCVREGAPFIRCSHSGGTFDFKTMMGLHAAPEIRGFNEDLADFYGLPRFGIGGVTGSKTVDQQASSEAALTLLVSAASGAQLIHDVGYMDNGKTGSLIQLVICHELIGWVKQFLKHVEVNDDTLALNDVRRVVNQEGDFLMSENTLTHYREDFYPELLDRMNCEAWEEKGADDLKERARKKVNEILAEADGRREAGQPGMSDKFDRNVTERLRELAYTRL